MNIKIITSLLDIVIIIPFFCVLTISLPGATLEKFPHDANACGEIGCWSYLPLCQQEWKFAS